MTQFFQYIKAFSVKKWIYMVLFSLFASKSLLISPFTLKDGAFGVILGMLIWIGMFILSTFILFMLDKINIQINEKPTKFTRTFIYMIPGVIMASIIYLGAYPAIIPYDTGFIYAQSKAMAFNNMHPIVYTMFIDFFAKRFDTLAVIVILQIIYCSFTYGYIGYVMEKNGISKKIVWTAVTIISIMPVNVIYSLTIIKDVPYIIPLIFITALIFDIISSDTLKPFHIAGLIIAAVIAWCARFNALLTIPAVFACIALMFSIKKQLKNVIIIATALILVVVGVKGAEKIAINQTNGEYFVFEGTSTIDIMPSLMLANIALDKRKELDESQQDFLNEYVNLGSIYNRNSEKEDSWIFNYNFMAMMNAPAIQSHKVEYYSQALPIIAKYPSIAFDAYEKITAIVWAVPNYGYTASRNRDICGVFDYNHPDIAPISQAVYDFQVSSPIYSGRTLYFLWRPALWMLLCLLILPIAIKRHGWSSLLLLSPMLFNAAGYMVANPAQNVRYLYLNATVLVIFTVFTLVKSTKKSTAD